MRGEALRRSGRCPRCGYPLRYDAEGYRCEFCGFSNTRPTVSASIRNLERSLRLKVGSLREKSRARRYERMIVQYPYALGQLICVSCGLRIPYGAQVCPYCAAPQSLRQPGQEPSAATTSGDQLVLDYIVAHHGTISISQAAKDLSTSPEALRLTIERLKSLGLLKPT
jgi:ribosomal protein L40E